MEIVRKEPPNLGKEIEAVVRAFDGVFMPPLSQRVDLHSYAEKLAQNANWILVYEEGDLVGHCAAYMNRGSCAYISSIAVRPGMQGRGIGGILWEYLEQEARGKGICRIELKVAKANLTGIQFYQYHKCKAIGEEDGWIMMGKEIG